MTNTTATAARGTRRTCPDCGYSSLERAVLPLHAPLPEIGHIVVRCRRCAYEATVETAVWNEEAA